MLSSYTALQVSFMDHIAKHGLSYATKEEFDFRQSIFEFTDKKLNEINARESNTFTVGHNFFSTMTKEEQDAITINKAPKPQSHDDDDFFELSSSDFEDISTLPNCPQGNVYYTPPLESRVGTSCSADYAFAAAEAMEGAYNQKMNYRYTLSKRLAVQQLIDCDPKSSGCTSGLTTYAFQYLTNNGIELESDYGFYTGKTGTCTADHTKAKARVASVTRVKSGDLTAFKTALITANTLTVEVDASSDVFKFYKTGILNDPACGTDTNFSMSAVSYCHPSYVNQTYVLVKNHWGLDWGYGGYIKLDIDNGMGTCGVLSNAMYPTLV